MHRSQKSQDKNSSTPNPWIAEAKALFSLGLPIALTQILQISLQTTDVLMVGRLGTDYMAAAALGNVLFFVATALAFGPVTAISPLVSRSYSAHPDDFSQIRKYVHAGLWVVAILSLGVGLFFLGASHIATWLGQPPNLVARAHSYLLALGPSFPFAASALVLRNFMAATRTAHIPMIAMIIAACINVLLNYALIFGHFGFPRLELVGAGIATVIAHACGLLFMIAATYLNPKLNRFQLFQKFSAIDWSFLKRVISLGWPIGVSFTLEIMLLHAGIFLMGVLGSNQVAAYQILLNLWGLIFMMPLGFSIAGCIRVGLAEGKNNRHAAKIASVISIILCTGTALVLMVPLVFWPQMIFGLYLNLDDPENFRTASIFYSILPIILIAMALDAVQVSANQSLRGLADVQIPMLLMGVSFGLIGFPIAHWLGASTQLGAVGVVYGILIAVVSATFFLLVRLFNMLAR